MEARRAKGDDILFVIASDHGHQTVEAVVDIEAELVAAGLKDAPSSADVLSMSNGTSALVYVAAERRDRVPAIGAFLEKQPWAGRVVSAPKLGEIGQVSRHGLAFAVSMAESRSLNAYGIPGLSFEAKPAPGKEDHLGCGQHGGLAEFEQSPFMLIQGGAFAAGFTRTDVTSAIDVAPTILTHLGVAFSGIDGRALQQ